MQNLTDKLWNDDELTKLEEPLPRLYRSANWKKCRDCTRQIQEWDAMIHTQKSRWNWWWSCLLEKMEQERKFSATSLHDDVLLDTEESHE